MKNLILMLLLLPMLAIGQSSSNSELTASAKLSLSSLDILSSIDNLGKSASLIKYTGHYKSELIPDFELDLFIEGDKLYGLKKGDTNRIEISPVGSSKFLIKEDRVQIQFLEDESGVQFMMIAKDEMTWLVKEK